MSVTRWPAVARLALAAVTSVALTACSRESAPPAPTGSRGEVVDPATSGTIAGRITLDGTPPAATMLRLDGDKTCATLVPDGARATERYVVGATNGLANVFVYIAGGLEGRSFPIPQEPVVLDQERCWYTPRVIGVRVGQPLVVANSDPLLHNVRAQAEVNAAFNQGQPVQGMRYSHTFSTAEVMVPMSCDVHAWMNAWVGVVNHPYFAVTGADGEFSLPNVPAGTYTVEAWHEAAGRQSGTVTVTERGTAALSLAFQVPTT